MSDNTRMHHSGKAGGDTPGMVPGRGHERHEEPVRLNHREPGEDQPGTTDASDGRLDDTSDMQDRHQPSALGSETATRSAMAAGTE